MKWLLNKLLMHDGGEIVRWWLQSGHGWPIWAILLGIAAVLGGSWWAYRPTRGGALEPQRPGMPAGRGLVGFKRWTMAVLRCLALFLLALVLVEPMLGYDRTIGDKPRLIVLLDDSQSMTIRDRRFKPEDQLAAAKALGTVSYHHRSAVGEVGDPDRAALLAAVWKNKELDLQAKLGRHYDLRFCRFGDDKNLNNDSEFITAADALKNLKFDDTVTNMGEALERSIANLRGRPAAGIVVMTDGQSNIGEDPTAAARVAAAEKLPVFPVGIGVTEAKDLRVAAFLSEDVVFINDDVTVYGILRQNGYTDEAVAVELRHDDQVIASDHVRLTGEAEQSFKLRFKPKVKGESNYRLSVEQRSDALVTEATYKEKRIKVIDEKIKVLLADQTPRWDFRFLKGALQRDTRVDLKVFLREGDGAELAAAGFPEYLAAFPEKREDLFKYDVIILGDIPSKAFSKEQLKLLEEFVSSNGGGLCFAAGPSCNPSTYKKTPLEPLVPVVFEAQPEPTAETELFAPLVQPHHLEITREGMASAVCALAENEPANAALWHRLPPFYWYFPATRLQPGATALVVHAEARNKDGRIPLVAHQYYGKGVTFYVGIETWRWRDRVGAKNMARFWGQAVNFLSAAHLLGESKRVQLTLDGRTYAVGGEVHISARVLDKSFQPNKAPEVIARIGLDQQEPVDTPLQALPNQPGMYSGSFLARAVGQYTVTVKGEESEGKASFVVQTPRLEFDKPAMDEQTLRTVAGLSGGKFFGLGDLDQLPDAIAKSCPLRTIPGSHPLWDTWSMLCVIVALLSVEWIIRKRNDLA